MFWLTGQTIAFSTAVGAPILLGLSLGGVVGLALDKATTKVQLTV
ncbi:hypothetical protein [Corynebacterium yudongzhengii]|nr:hypothetical protein [Corynebacterium yudongzhengii]